MITKIACSFFIVIGLTGCYHSVEITKEDLRDESSTIHVYTSDSLHLRFTEKQYNICSDTLTGFGSLVLKNTVGDTSARAIPLSDIKKVEVRKVNTRLVLGLVGGAVIVGAAYYWISKVDLDPGDHHIRLFEWQ